MNVIFKILFMMFISTVLAYSAPARGGVLQFKQPDGRSFSGILRGDASFHWIESGANIVLFNSQDKFYYKAKVTQNGKIELSNEKMYSTSLKRDRNFHKVSKVLHQALMQKLLDSKKGNFPR